MSVETVMWVLILLLLWYIALIDFLFVELTFLISEINPTRSWFVILLYVILFSFSSSLLGIFVSLFIRIINLQVFVMSLILGEDNTGLIGLVESVLSILEFTYEAIWAWSFLWGQFSFLLSLSFYGCSDLLFLGGQFGSFFYVF